MPFRMSIFVYTCIVMLTSLFGTGETFILDGTSCNVPSPCTCSTNFIRCDSKSLTSIPTIYPFSSSFSTLVLYFSSNQLVNVSSNVFQNVSSANASRITLYLYSNKIATIAESAFSGIENDTTYLHLDNNLLTSIPVAIGNLRNLQTLLLRNNPLRTLDVQVLSHLQSLNAFYVSLGNMTSWPDNIHVLRNLQELYVDHIYVRSLPSNAFHGFETTLHILSLSYTNFEHIPEHVCNLKHLRSFTFNNNDLLVGNLTLQNLCHTPLNEVTSLYLQHDKISHFPDGIFTTFPNLTHLHLSYNKLRYVPVESLPLHTLLTYLKIDYNMLGSIPFALNRLTALQSLDLQGNHIYALEHNELTRLRHLSQLYLASNPLEYVDPFPFGSQKSSLTVLDLDNTHLDRIPVAVTTLTHLNTLYFYQSHTTECSCDRMSHLRSWNVASINILGSCELTNELIKDYLTQSLPNCPVR